MDQIQPVLEDAARHPEPTIIGGDFNTNDFYWIGRVLPLPGSSAQTALIRSAMAKRGFQTLFPARLSTFPLFALHLDWIFTRGFVWLDANIEPASFSDHNAIWVRIAL